MTMLSNIAQTELIRDTYARAGLDINNPQERPQFFHAHGTGTPAGDPQEAEAISRSFFGGGQIAEKLYVGSIKTVIGYVLISTCEILFVVFIHGYRLIFSVSLLYRHTEGSAGLASLIGSALAMQHGFIPPNLHFKRLSDRVAPFYDYLQIPTSAVPWPATLPGQPRRTSVNSFGKPIITIEKKNVIGYLQS